MTLVTLMIRKVVERVAARYRMHDYDWENPEVLTVDGVFIGGKPYTYTVFTCRDCGYNIAIDKSMANHLPRNLKYGCRGKDEKSERSKATD